MTLDMSIEKKRDYLENSRLRRLFERDLGRKKMG